MASLGHQDPAVENLKSDIQRYKEESEKEVMEVCQLLPDRTSLTFYGKEVSVAYHHTDNPNSPRSPGLPALTPTDDIHTKLASASLDDAPKTTTAPK